MRKILASLCVVAALAAFGCAGTKPASSTSSPTLSVSEALTQAQGAATALATLAQTSPMDAATKAQMANWAVWADFALKAAGIVSSAAGI